MLSFEMDLTVGVLVPDLGPGWELRHVRGEDEADNRREASHRAFASTMDRKLHLERCASCDLRSMTANAIWWRSLRTDG
jgi:hypothetical protein